MKSTPIARSRGDDVFRHSHALAIISSRPRVARQPEHLGGEGGVGIDDRCVRAARAARALDDGHGSVGCAAHRIDDLPHRDAVAGTEIEGEHRVFIERFEGADVRLGEIEDMDVIADAGAVRRWVSVPRMDRWGNLPSATARERADEVRLMRAILAAPLVAPAG